MSTVSKKSPAAARPAGKGGRFGYIGLSVPRIWTIATNTWLESMRRKMLLILLIFGLISVGSSISFAELTPAEEVKFIIDMSVGSIRFFGMLIAILLGATMIPQEIERRTIHVLLSKPVTRAQFLLGKYLGALLTVFTNVVLMSAVFLGVYYFKERMIDPNVVQWLILILLELLVLTAFSVTISTFSTTMFNFVLSFFIYFLGHLSTMFKEVAHSEKYTALGRGVFQGLYWIVPRFENFDIREAVLLGNRTPWGYVGETSLTALGYALLATIVGLLLFNEKEF